MHEAGLREDTRENHFESFEVRDECGDSMS